MTKSIYRKINRSNKFDDKIYFTGRVPQADQILYQTERYHGATFGYDMPVLKRSIISHNNNNNAKHTRWMGMETTS